MGASLQEACLWYADFREANLRSACLQGADLEQADLIGADLTGANLDGTLVTNEQLVQAKSLRGATMPDGTKHQ